MFEKYWLKSGFGVIILKYLPFLVRAIFGKKCFSKFFALKNICRPQTAQKKI